jgi:fermentation-respiration switch protein FrsA (DUF1100 family)
MWYALVISFIILIFLFICLQIAFTIVLPKTRTLERTKKMETDKDPNIFNFYETHLSKKSFIKSRYGYSLALYYFLNTGSNKFVVIAHGHTHSHHGCIKYAKMMFEYGYNVVLYDQRYHGNSGGKNTTLGFYEKYDLYDIITKVFQEFGEGIYLGTYGESMGGATVLLEQEGDERIKFCISDCSFSSLDRLIKDQFRSKHLPKFIYFFVNWFVKIITGINLEEVSPIKSIIHKTVPVLFIHGQQDNLINYQHTLDMYDACTGKKRLFIAKNNATHAVSFYSDNEDYMKIVKEFVEEDINDNL